MKPQSDAVSAIIVCYNEKDRIEECLRSVAWCDEIVVVDSFSTDGTAEICRRYTDRVIQRPWAGYRDQKAFAHSQASKPWVLLVDADERVSPELAREIGAAIREWGDRCAAFAVPRLVRYLGRWWWRGGWYPDYDVRLFRGDRATWGGTDPHERIIVDGRVRKLRNPLYHFSYRDVFDHVARVDRFTDISSAELKSIGQRWNWAQTALRPAFRFFRFYVWKRGFLDGFAGFFVAATAAVYVFLKYAKLRELELEPLAPPAPISANGSSRERSSR